MKFLLYFLVAGLVLLLKPIQASAADHPSYLHALSDLRAARWMIDHRPGNWQQTVEERDAVAQIDQAIDLIKKASIDDGKNLNDHPPVDEKPDRAGRLQLAVDFLEKARSDVNQEEDNGFANGLKDQSLRRISEALARTRLAINAGPTDHPSYLHALSDLRAARWMIDHRPGNWQQNIAEKEAVTQIDQAIDVIKKASIDDGKDINDHPAVDEKPDHAGRLQSAADFLEKARSDVNQEEDNAFANGLKGQSFRHISQALTWTKHALDAGREAHPNYLLALSDLRAARWLVDHGAADAHRSAEENNATAQIDLAIDFIKKASIDDGKNVNDHPPVDEKPDRAGRLHEATEFVEKAVRDVNLQEDNPTADGFKQQAMQHMSEAIRRIGLAIQS
jgi:predicted RNase H-like HicB family nuclease